MAVLGHVQAHAGGNKIEVEIPATSHIRASSSPTMMRRCEWAFDSP